MRWRLVMLAMAGLLAACGSTSLARSSSAPPPVCGPVFAKTLASSATARVFLVADTVSGCSIHGIRSYRLGQRATCQGSARVAPAIVAGDMAAYGLERCFVDTGATVVVVRRLSDGKQLRTSPATTPPGVESFQSIDCLVVKQDGAVAWIGSGSSIVGRGQRRIEVYKADARGPVKLLDSGASVKRGSLRLHGSRLTWKHAGSTRSARLS